MGAEEQKQETIEGSRPNPNPNPNPITEAQFLSWKRQKDADASARKAEAARKRAEDIAAGIVQMNGRSFSFVNLGYLTMLSTEVNNQSETMEAATAPNKGRMIQVYLCNTYHEKLS